MIRSLANNLLGKLGLRQHVKDVTECDDKFFVDIYEQTLSEKLPGKKMHTYNIYVLSFLDIARVVYYVCMLL